MRMGGGDYVKYLKRGWNRKQKRRKKQKFLKRVANCVKGWMALKGKGGGGGVNPLMNNDFKSGIVLAAFVNLLY